MQQDQRQQQQLCFVFFIYPGQLCDAQFLMALQNERWWANKKALKTYVWMLVNVFLFEGLQNLHWNATWWPEKSIVGIVEMVNKDIRSQLKVM